jgi:hypothetical protein
MIEVERADEIELNNGVIIMVKTSDFRAIRGLTVAAAILDEVAFWDSEGISPDHEVLTALRPATSTIPGAKIIAISTPYSQSGSLYEAYKEHYGKDDEHTLVWVAESRSMNPTLDQASRHQYGLRARGAGFQSRFDKSTAQAEQKKEGALRVL